MEIALVYVSVLEGHLSFPLVQILSKIAFVSPVLLRIVVHSVAVLLAINEIPLVKRSICEIQAAFARPLAPHVGALEPSLSKLPGLPALPMLLVIKPPTLVECAVRLELCSIAICFRVPDVAGVDASVCVQEAAFARNAIVLELSDVQSLVFQQDTSDSVFNL